MTTTTKGTCQAHAQQPSGYAEMSCHPVKHDGSSPRDGSTGYSKRQLWKDISRLGSVIPKNLSAEETALGSLDDLLVDGLGRVVHNDGALESQA